MAKAKAQILFAREKCGKVSRLKSHNFLVNYLGIWGVPLKPADMKTLEGGVDGFKANFEAAWQTLDKGQQDNFCNAYYNDVAQNARAFSILPPEFYAYYLSPVSEEGIEQFERAVKRAEKVKWLAFFAQVASLAAQERSVSSCGDGVCPRTERAACLFTMPCCASGLPGSGSKGKWYVPDSVLGERNGEESMAACL